MFADSLFQFKTIALACVIAFILGATGSSLVVHKLTADTYKLKIAGIEKSTLEEKEKLRKEAEASRGQIEKMKTQLEDSHAEALKKLADMDQRYRSVVRAAGGLRDAYAVCKRTESTGSSGSGSGGAGGSELPATTDGENGTLYLSIETSEWLLTKFANADKVVQQFKTCKAYSLKLKEIIDAYNRGDSVPPE